VRVDHFRGFVAYWEVPRHARTATSGRWRRGPGRAVFDAATRELGELPVVAEDLGDITPPVVRLRRELGYPGMAVLQFAFTPGDEHSIHEPANHEEHMVVYTATHDSDTAAGWWATLPEHKRSRAREAFANAGTGEGEGVNWAMIRLAHSSRADLAMMQAQDVLGLGSEGRMNVPGVAAGAWKWRMAPGALTSEHAERLRESTRASGRL
jgi:4-alpha-glucanotransferase